MTSAAEATMRPQKERARAVKNIVRSSPVIVIERLPSQRRPPPLPPPPPALPPPKAPPEKPPLRGTDIELRLARPRSAWMPASLPLLMPLNAGAVADGRDAPTPSADG